VEGGYVWRYSADLEKREGEGKLDHRTAWVEPPGTAFIGDGYLEVFELTGEPTALEAARETSRALLKGQLHSSGWCERIDFDPKARRGRAYLVDGEPVRKARDLSILDDDRTQSVIRFLVRYDRVTGFEDREVGEAARRALKSLLAAQHRNGAWAQVYRGPAPDTGRDPSLRASLREDGEYRRIKAHWDYYTLNDDVISECIQTMLYAAEVYDEERFLEPIPRALEYYERSRLEDGTLRYWGKGDPTRRIIDPRTFVRNIRLLGRYAGDRGR